MKVWIPAKIAASTLMIPTMTLSPCATSSWFSVANRLVPTAVVKITTGSPSMRLFFRSRDATR